MNPQGDFYYKDINTKLPMYVYDPLTRENSGILGERYQFGIFRGKTNYKQAEKVALDHMFNLRSQHRKIAEMEQKKNLNSWSSMLDSPYTNPIYMKRSFTSRYPLSNIAHATRIYPVPEPERVQKTQPSRQEVQSALNMDKKAGVYRGGSARARRKERDIEQLVEYDTNNRKIKSIVSNDTKKRGVPKRRKQPVPPEGDITGFLQKSRPWSKKSQTKKNRKVVGGSAVARRGEIGEDSNGPITIKEHDHIDPIQEKDEKEEDDQTYTVNIGEGNSQSKKSYEGKKGSTKNLKEKSIEVEERREEEGEFEGFEYIQENNVNMSSVSGEEKGRKKEESEVKNTSSNQMKTTDLVRQVDVLERDEVLFEEGEDDEIPVLKGDSDKESEEFIQKLGMWIQKYEVEDQEQLEGLFEAVANKNPQILEEDLAEIFQSIINQLNANEQEYEDEETDHIQMIA